MANFTGIRNENEFYFAHYLTSLMDDDLKAGLSEDLTAVVERFKSCSDDWYRWASIRRRYLAESPDRDDRAKMAEVRKTAISRLLAALGWSGDVRPGLAVPGASSEFSAIPVLGLVRTAAGEPAVLLVESSRPDYEVAHRKEPTLLGNRVTR